MNDQLTLGDFAPPLDPERDQYHTPVKLARKMVEWAGLDGAREHTVLEPSFGGGNIVREIIKAGHLVTGVEIDRNWYSLVKQEFRYDYSANLWCGNFLKMVRLQLPNSNLCDLCIANPPLTGGVGAKHVRHALRFAPRAVSLLRGQDLHGVARWEELWSVCDLARIAFLVRRPVFTGAGGQTEFVCVDVRRKGTYNGPVIIEFWPDSWN